MTQIRIVGPLYIDNELELKKIEIFFKRPPRGDRTLIWGLIYRNVPGRHFFWPDDSSNSRLGYQKLISVEISGVFFRLGHFWALADGP